ncbi:hypothetical protein [Sporosarcina pasteurii]|uniref:Uncharacterized protein n=1 Tax=Sporosarcina pasteurii TaxID=1474 RepID=A0A380BGN9_SPOPA|nr:hypothetical protein [Sporosarcina pasteurii]MDS9470433.1 hypothetical protein [Sporosarcina pasteurii]QBQ05868.1 hypothetical protein E2C16_09370 [Sporosarcina pasteurii]SUJ00247.1 Uncharacterised protein [Sporosarcina pasteurii]
MGKKMIFYLDPDDRKWTMEDLGLSWDTIHLSMTRNHTIEGTFLMKDGEVYDSHEVANRCAVCLNPLAYHDDYDSHFCPDCDEWREETCSDSSCEYCLERPEKPSHCKEI